MNFRRAFILYLCAGVSIISCAPLAADTILENGGTFAHTSPFTIQRNTDAEASENHLVVIEGDGAKFEIIADSSSDPALTLQDGITLNLGTGGQFAVRNDTGPAIATPSSSGYKNAINLQGGTFDISAGATAIDGSGNLQLNISTGGSIVGTKAVENLHSFTLSNDSESYLGVTGLLDLSNAAQTADGGVTFADGAAIRLIPLASEKSTGTLGGAYTENGNTYIKLGTGANVTYDEQLNIALDVKNFYTNTSPPSSTQWIKLMEGNKVADLQSLLHLTVENDTSSFPGWVLNYVDDLNTIYAKFTISSVIPVTDLAVTTNCDDRYIFTNSSAVLTISSTGSIESVGEIPILIDTSKSLEPDIIIAIESNSHVAVSNTNGVAIGQGTADGSPPFPAEGADFYSPNVNIVGTGTIYGSAGSFKMCATEITPNVDYTETRSKVTIGSLTIGDETNFTHMDGPIEMRFFNENFGNANVGLGACIYTINPFTLVANSRLSGHLLLDASIKTSGTISDTEAYILMNDFTINGTIAGKVNDAYGICASLNPWADGVQISSYLGNISVGGDITAHSECIGNYIGLLIDAPTIQLGVAGITIAGNIDATAGNISDDNVRIGALVHAPLMNGCIISGNIKGNSATVVFDGSGDDALEVPISLGNATLQSDKVAIGGRNANLHFASSSTLNVASTAQFAIAPCVPTYAYNNGATDVTALEIFATETDSAEKLSSINSAKLALLRGSNLSLQVDANASFNANGMDIAVTGLELGEASAITCGTLFLGGAAGIGSGALHVADGIIFCPDASVDASRTASKLSVTMAENVFGIISSEDAFTGVPKIDASFAAVGDDTNPYGAAIDISTLSVSAILPEGIRGNLSDGSEFSAATAERYASVELGGEGGSIGTESVATSGVSDVGKLVINGSSNDSVWTIHGNTSCGTLRIEKGKMVQKGNLTVWGDLLLLGCDIDWTGAASFNHVYAEEDKITVREGATVKIANGFSAENVGVEPITLEDVQLKQEAVLLGGNSQFIVEPNTTVSIGVAGCDESKFGTANEPVGIRVVGNSLKLGEALRQWPKDGQIIGNGNVIDLRNSLNLHYYTPDGTRITPESNKKVTAIRGNETTRLFLNGGTTGAQNHLPGIISNVGHVTVNGYWNVPNGLDECGHLTLGPSGQLNCAGADVNTYLITFRLDGPRNRNSGDVEKVPYLVCSKLYNTYEDGSVPVCFNLELSDNLLSDANSFEFCLVAGLSVQPQWVCGTKINGIKPTISFANDKLMATIPGIMANDVTRNVEFAAPDEYAMRNFWERGLLIPYSVHQANITRKQNDLFRHALGPGNGNFANAGGKNWHLTRTSYVSLLRRGRAGPIINAVSANTTGSTIGLKRKLPQGHLLAVSADYAVSHAHFRVWNNSKSYRCRMKSHGLGAGGRFVNGPMRFGLTGVVNENSNRYGWEMGRLANVRFNGYSYNLAGNFSYALPYGKWTISPRLEGSFDNIYHKNYAIDNGNMNISPCRTKFFQGALGIHASVHEENWQFIGDLSLCHDFQCSGGFSTATSTRTSFITMPAYFPRRDRIDGKLQVSIPWRKSCEFAFDCAATLQRHSWDSSITIGSIYYF